MDIKNRHQDSILFFRLGDFYEMFFEDAKLVSEELDLTLTGKDYGRNERAPMCGIPYHSCEMYISRLVSKGYKIAICDQIEAANDVKGLVKREVVRVITPGTVIEGSMLDESKNNYICSIYSSDSISGVGIAFCDVSTGELKVTELFGDTAELISQTKTELGKFNPREILFNLKPEIEKSLSKFINEKLNCSIEQVKEKLSYDYCHISVKKHFNYKTLKGSKFENKICAIKSIAYLLEYLKSTQKGSLNNINVPIFYDKHQYMGLDLNTIRNLELLETMRTNSKKGSLLWIMDMTKTAMGKRLLRTWIERPLIDKTKILKRQAAVEELVNNPILRGNLKETLSKIHDIQRLMTKISYATANARDLKSFSFAIGKLPEIKMLLSQTSADYFKKMYNMFDNLSDIHALIEDAICAEPAATVKEGGIIRDGYSEKVDSFRKDINGGEETSREIEKKERKRTGISKLKVDNNKVFGYYIEVTNSFKHLVPANYVRKQTLTNCERYTTEEIKELEIRILNAKDKINETEYKIFEEIRNKVSKSFSRVMSVSNIIASLDVIRSLAEIAVNNDYIKPEIDECNSIRIKQGRHPVIETLIKDGTFVPNDVILDNEENTIAIITGPNMAGKSTYMRQTALIVLMAQMGSFVPASEAHIGIVDNIFTRIGASDDLSTGNSTFMVEMTEVADIIKSSTYKSLLILDEIGRGTSTFDGMSIARAVLEYVANKRKLGAKTLFATHYHELTSITSEFKNVKNYNIAVKKLGDEIIFLRSIVPGASDDSYGIEVAKLAGLPKSIILRAKEVLAQIENISNVPQMHQKKAYSENPFDLNIMPSEAEEILRELKDLKISTLTPIESINVLYKLINKAQKIDT